MEAGRRAIVTIRTRAGRALTEEVRHRPMTQEELDLKFAELVTPRFGSDKCARVGKSLKALESAASVKAVVQELGGA